MEWIIGGRGEGKTKKMLQMSAETGAYIVCASHQEAVRLRNAAQKLGLGPIPFPLTYDAFVAGQFYGRGIRGFLIDCAEDLLRYMCKEVPLLAAVATVDIREEGDGLWTKTTTSSVPQSSVDGKG